jgi:hypothetical protein
MASNTDFFENKLIDFLFRAQALGIGGATAAAGTGPSTLYIGLLSAAGDDGAAGTELTGGSYARVAVVSSLANWAGTQGAGTTAVSTGSSGTTSNNVAITFPAPTAAWGVGVEWAAYDAATAGNRLIRAPLAAQKTINSGDPAPAFAPATLTYQIDN